MILTTPQEIIDDCLAKYGHTTNLLFGMACQKTHDEYLKSQGVSFKTFDDYYPYDRQIGEDLYDDKCALWKNGEHAKTHTIGVTEMPVWRKKPPIINSFIQKPDHCWSFEFVKTYNLREVHLHKTSFRDGAVEAYYFWR